jgi:hypothetical protein
MIKALGKIVKLKKVRPLSAHDFHLPLCDILLDLVEQDIDGPFALRFSQLAHSLSHDFINLATLAGQLLWYEGVTPDMSRSPDLLAISGAAESYLIFLRTACDVIAGAFAIFCIEPKKQGQVPGKSFHDLIRWAKDNPTRIFEAFRFLPEHWDWFMELRGIRDKLIHLGYDLNIYTDRISFLLILMPTGESELQLLHGGYKQEDYHPDQPPRFRQYPLLPLLKRFTENVLGLSAQLAKAIGEQRKHKYSQTHVLNGVYIPALHHILSYKVPVEQHPVSPKQEHILRIKAWYLVRAGDYLKALNFGYPSNFWWHFVIRISELFGERPPSHMSDPQYPDYRDSEILIEWRLIFTKEGKRFGLLLRDATCPKKDGQPTLRDQIDAFKRQFEIESAALVLNSHLSPENQLAELVADSDPIRAAESAFGLLTSPIGKSSDSVQNQKKE